jgi:hypothetical protein
MLHIVEIYLGTAGDMFVDKPMITVATDEEIIWFSQVPGAPAFEVRLIPLTEAAAHELESLLLGRQHVPVGRSAVGTRGNVLRSSPLQVARLRVPNTNFSDKWGYRIVAAGTGTDAPAAPLIGLVAVQMLAGTSGGVVEPEN